MIAKQTTMRVPSYILINSLCDVHLKMYDYATLILLFSSRLKLMHAKLCSPWIRAYVVAKVYDYGA